MGRLPVPNIAGPLSHIHDDLVAYYGIAGKSKDGCVLLSLAVIQALPSLPLRLGGGLAVLAALALKEKNIKTSMEAERGTWAEHWMWIGNTEDAIYAKYKNGTFTIFRGIKYKDDDNEKLFSTGTDNPIDEATKFVVEELI